MYIASRVYGIKILISYKNYILKNKKFSNSWFGIEQIKLKMIKYLCN